MSPSKYDSAWAPEMLALAEEWELYESTTSYTAPIFHADGSMEVVTHDDVPCFRCHNCGQIVLADTTAVKAQHLVINHGYRMDGRKENEQ